jgi:hypothetical protein
LAIADIDGAVDAKARFHDRQRDMRARLFRERSPEAFKILTEANPPVLDKVPIDRTRRDGPHQARALTVGEDEFRMRTN